MELKMQIGESFADFTVRVMNNLEEFGLTKQQAFKELFGKEMAIDNVRKVGYFATYIQEAIDNGLDRKFMTEVVIEETKDDFVPNYKSTHEILSDGSHKSDKLVKMDSEQAKDSKFLLEAHGFNFKNWELLNAKNNIWNSYSKTDGIMTLYSSKITVKPKAYEFNLDWFKEQFEKIEEINPQEFPYPENFHTPNLNKVVEIQYADLHIGLRGLEYEEELNAVTDEIIEKYKYAETFILPIGQDWLNSDYQIGANFKTTRGTDLEQTLDYKEMYQCGLRVACRIIDNILSKTSANIDCIYISANHDKHSAFGLFCSLMQRYNGFTHNAIVSKRIDFDDSTKPRKYRKYGVNGIGIAHGDKEGKRIFNAFQVEAPTIFASTKFREFHLSHLHNESVKDEGGIVYRRLPTPNTPDNWHTELGFIGSSNRVQVFVYDLDKGLESINYHYINKAD